MIRLVLLLLVLGGVTLFALQNWSPVLPIVFLGIKTVSLPLAMWILIAIATGLFTSVLMALLFQLSNYSSQKQLLKRIRELEAGASPVGKSRVGGESNSSSSQDDDFIDNEFFENDFLQDEEDREESYKNSNYQDYTPNSGVYERGQQPKTTSQSGSVYSYSYRDNKDSGAGKTESVYDKTESVYDADYRVINPPLRKLDDDREDDWTRKSNTNDDDDWGFDDLDEFDDKDDKRR